MQAGKNKYQVKGSRLLFINLFRSTNYQPDTG